MSPQIYHAHQHSNVIKGTYFVSSWLKEQDTLHTLIYFT